MRVEFINPFVSATLNTFETMLGTTLSRGAVRVKDNHSPSHEVSGLIGFAGSYHGMVVLSIGRPTAINVTEKLLGLRPESVDSTVLDAVGELTNIIAGGAKSELEALQLCIGLPSVICGKSRSLPFPSGAPAIEIPFESDIGSLCIEIGLAETVTH